MTTPAPIQSPEAERAKSQAELLVDSGDLDAYIASLDTRQAARLAFDFSFWRRPAQVIPPLVVGWLVWFILTGRGWGKTWTGGSTVHDLVMNHGYRRIGLIGETIGDVRNVMVEGNSGILAVSPPWERPLYEPSKRRLTWPNGAIATTYSAEKPGQLRGPEHDLIWGDEAAKWKQKNGKCEAWDNFMLGLRVGTLPKAIITTTPRPTKFIRDVIDLDSVSITRGHSGENRSNIAPDYYNTVLAPYIGTRLGRQEIEGQVLEDIEGALWTHDMIDEHRVPGVIDSDGRAGVPEGVRLIRLVIGVDPYGGGPDEVGIVAAAKGDNGHYYVLRDRSCQGSPSHWAGEVFKVYSELRADRVIGESNFGGQMVESTIRNAAGGSVMAYSAVNASRGKVVRAEPISTLYETGLVHHVGMFQDLEDQMTSWTQDSPDSPDRLDALVWALTDLSDTAGQGVW